MKLEYNSKTTLNYIRAADPCKDGWTRLLSHLGKTKADNEPLDLVTVLDSNGLDDALWVLSYAMPDDRLSRHFKAWCAEQVLHLFEAEFPGDSRVLEQVAMLRNDTATNEERAAARDAAWAAARDAAWAAARDAVEAAARDAAGAAARDAAWAAARDAAEAAAWAAARAAAWAAADAAQEKQLRAMLTQEAAT